MTEPTTNPVNLPREIGGYRIVRVLGSGGMATVYAALQTQPRRTVALKVMKAGVSMARGDAAYRRFKREIEILGKLSHPYIAQVYGAGTHDDGSGATPYFVMEYVPGALTIIEYVATKQLDIRERLKLFVKVCAAIEHGHRRKIIHRDLKPANILIDENGDPKIIDFGVAHAAEMDITSQTMHTEAGRIVGTLQYMSPEQLDATLQDLDARCDVYALGVLLYKMLTGKPPHDLEALPVYEAVRIIREESPKSPSEVKPEVFRGNIRGADLETIILKAMEPERARRYRNAGSLGRDIVRFLADKPINARRAGLLYRAGLFVRRHRGAVIAGGIVMLVILLAAAVIVNERTNRSQQANTNAATNPPPQAPSSDAISTTTLAPAPITLTQHTGTITRLAYSPDGSRLLSASFDRSVLIWNVFTGEPLASIAEMDSPIRHAAFNGDGSRVIIAGRGDTAQVLNISNIGQEPLSLHGPHTTNIRIEGGTICAVAMNEAGDRVAIALEDFTLRVFFVSAGQATPKLTLRSASGALTCAAFNKDGAMIAAGSQAGPVYVWNTTDGALITKFDDCDEEIITIGFTGSTEANDESAAATQSPNRVLAITVDGMAMSWPLSPDDATPKTTFRASRSPMVDASFAPGHRWIICASANEISLWDVHNFPPVQHGNPIKREDVIFAVAVNPTGDRIAIGTASGDIVLIPRPAPPP